MTARNQTQPFRVADDMIVTIFVPPSVCNSIGKSFVSLFSLTGGTILMLRWVNGVAMACISFETLHEDVNRKQITLVASAKPKLHIPLTLSAFSCLRRSVSKTRACRRGPGLPSPEV